MPDYGDSYDADRRPDRLPDDTVQHCRQEAAACFNHHVADESAVYRSVFLDHPARQERHNRKAIGNDRHDRAYDLWTQRDHLRLYAASVPLYLSLHVGRDEQHRQLSGRSRGEPGHEQTSPHSFRYAARDSSVYPRGVHHGIHDLACGFRHAYAAGRGVHRPAGAGVQRVHVRKRDQPQYGVRALRDHCALLAADSGVSKICRRPQELYDELSAPAAGGAAQGGRNASGLRCRST